MGWFGGIFEGGGRIIEWSPIHLEDDGGIFGILGGPQVHLGAPWGELGASWGRMQAPKGLWGALWGHRVVLGAVWGVPGSFWGTPRAGCGVMVIWGGVCFHPTVGHSTNISPLSSPPSGTGPPEAEDAAGHEDPHQPEPAEPEPGAGGARGQTGLRGGGRGPPPPPGTGTDPALTDARSGQ